MMVTQRADFVAHIRGFVLPWRSNEAQTGAQVKMESGDHGRFSQIQDVYMLTSALRQLQSPNEDATFSYTRRSADKMISTRNYNHP